MDGILSSSYLTRGEERSREEKDEEGQEDLFKKTGLNYHFKGGFFRLKYVEDRKEKNLTVTLIEESEKELYKYEKILSKLGWFGLERKKDLEQRIRSIKTRREQNRLRIMELSRDIRQYELFQIDYNK